MNHRFMVSRLRMSVIDKPSCFSQPNLNRVSPCHRCGVLGHCVSAANRTSVFSVMLWPRAVDISNSLPPDTRPAPAFIDPDLHAKFRDVLRDHVGLKSLGQAGWWWHGYPGAPTSHKVFRVMECRMRQVSLEFAAVTADRLAMVPQSRRGVVIRPHGVPTRRPTDRLTIAELRKRRSDAPGSVAMIDDPSVALALIVAVVRTIYSV